MEMSTETTNVLQSYIENKNESFEFWLTIHYKIKGKNVYDKHYIYEGNILYSDNHYGGKIIFKEMRLASKISLEDFVEFMNDTLMNKTVWKEEYNEKHFEAKIRSVEKIKEDYYEK